MTLCPYPLPQPDLPTRLLTVLRAQPPQRVLTLDDLCAEVREGWRLPATLRDLEHAGLVQSWLIEDVRAGLIISRRYYAAEA